MATNNAANEPTAATGKVLQGQGVGTASNFSTATYPSTATTTGQVLRADGTNWVGSTATYPNTAGTSGNVLTSDGTNWLSSPTAIASPGTSTDRAIATWNGTTGNALRNNASAIIDSSGRFTNTSQTAFMAYLNTTITNVTGDGTLYTIIFDTEVFDQGNDFTLGSSTFTAPVTGKYEIDYNCAMIGGTNITSSVCTAATSNRNYSNPMPANITGNATCTGNVSVLADFDAADTATFTVQLTDGGLKIDDVSGLSGGNLVTWVSGVLSC